MFCPIDDPLDDLTALDGDAEDRHLRLLYRDELRHAAGRNVAVHAHVRAGERHAYRLETTWLPTYEVPAIRGCVAVYLVSVTVSCWNLVRGQPGGLQPVRMPLARPHVGVHGDVAPGGVPEFVPVQQPQVPVFRVTVQRRQVIQRIIDRAEHGEFVLDGRGDGEAGTATPCPC